VTFGAAECSPLQSRATGTAAPAFAVSIPTWKEVALISRLRRDSVQIHERRRALDLAALAAKLSVAGVAVKKNDFLLKFGVPPYEMTVFSDGRAVLKGSTDPAVARSLYARYIGT
jgi:hypothetical protein